MPGAGGKLLKTLVFRGRQLGGEEGAGREFDKLCRPSLRLKQVDAMAAIFVLQGPPPMGCREMRVGNDDIGGGVPKSEFTLRLSQRAVWKPGKL